MSYCWTIYQLLSKSFMSACFYTLYRQAKFIKKLALISPCLGIKKNYIFLVPTWYLSFRKQTCWIWKKFSPRKAARLPGLNWITALWRRGLLRHSSVNKMCFYWHFDVSKSHTADCSLTQGNLHFVYSCFCREKIWGLQKIFVDKFKWFRFTHFISNCLLNFCISLPKTKLWILTSVSWRN